MTARHPFLARLAQGAILGDGAMGTLLFARGVPMDACLEALNLEEPDRVLAVHRAYLEAGAQVIETNTFGANWVRLGAWRDTGERARGRGVRALNLAAASLARRAVTESERLAFVAGSIGPLGRILPCEDATEAFREQAEALLEGGIDLLMIETITALAEMRAALRAIRPLSDVPLVAQMTFGAGRRSADGADPATAAHAMQVLGADVVGANCGIGPAHTIEVIRAMRVGCDLPLAAQPSAGLPESSGHGLVYPGTPASFAEAVAALRDEGVALIGGCCGTTPAHIAAVGAGLRALTGDMTG